MTDTQRASEVDEHGERRREPPVAWLFLAGAAAVTLWFYRDFIFHPERLIFGSDMLLEVKHGEPLVFGKEKDKGIRFNGTRLEVIHFADGHGPEGDRTQHALPHWRRRARR